MARGDQHLVDLLAAARRLMIAARLELLPEDPRYQLLSSLLGDLGSLLDSSPLGPRIVDL